VAFAVAFGKRFIKEREQEVNKQEKKMKRRKNE
jgi:hypothetical protein